MTEVLRVLLVEDNDDDAELLRLRLRRDGFAPSHVQVDDEKGFRDALARDLWDIVLCDYHLPRFSGVRALEVLREMEIDLPVIMVSGAIGDELAVETMRMGASDYLLKDRLQRLGGAVRQTVAQHRLAREMALAEQALQRSRALNDAILESLASHIAVLDRAGNILTTNNAWRRLGCLGGAGQRSAGIPATGVGSNYLDACARAKGPLHQLALTAAAGIRSVIDGSRDSFTLEYPCHLPSERCWLEMWVTPLVAGNGGVVVAHRDISERRRAEEDRRLAQRVLAQTAEGVVVMDSGYRILSVNPAFESMLGLSEKDVRGRDGVVWLMEALAGKDLAAALRRSFRAGGYWKGEVSGRRRNGATFPALITINSVEDDAGEVRNLVVVVHDLTEIRDFESRLDFLAHFDALTRLPNRLRFEQLLEWALGRVNSAVVVLFDIDGFREINDSMGHRAGDQLLCGVAERLRATFGEQIVIGRLGGDEFGVAVEASGERGAWDRVIAPVLDAFRSPFVVGDDEIFMTVSFGITRFPEDGADAPVLVQHADIAMCRAKTAARGSWEYFDPAMSDQAGENLFLVNGLRRALDDDALQLVYQPQVELASGRITATEVLLRWHHPDRGWISPARFIPLAEDTGLIDRIDEWVLARAATEVLQWPLERWPELRIAVNISARHLVRSNLLERVLGILNACGLPATRLEVEITEGALVRDPSQAAQVLADMAQAGLTTAIDDFGTGYSSLSYLKHLPLTCLKLDKSFVAGLPWDQDDAAIARAVLALARTLGLRVVAEGVETEGQLQFLAQAGCDQIQGFLASHPVDSTRMAEILSNDGPLLPPKSQWLGDLRQIPSGIGDS